MLYFVYILRNASNKLYIGQTNNLGTRVSQHTKKDWKAAVFTKAGASFKLCYREEYATRLEAVQREHQL